MDDRLALREQALVEDVDDRFELGRRQVGEQIVPRARPSWAVSASSTGHARP
jgi:hypothetical protein